MLSLLPRRPMFCRERGLMKDIPALLCTVLSVKDRALLNFVFPCVIDNPKMLLHFGQRRS